MADASWEAQTPNFIDAVRRILDTTAPTRVKLLALIRIRHGKRGKLPAETEMVLASVSQPTHKRLSKKANDLIIKVGLDLPIDKKLPKLSYSGAPPFIKKHISSSLRASVFQRDGFTCLSCGSTENLTIDHIIAEKNGGITAFENLQTLCRSCNRKKGVK